MSRSKKDGKRGGSHKPQPGRDFPPCGCCDFPEDKRDQVCERLAEEEAQVVRSAPKGGA